VRTWCLSGSTTLGIQEGMIREPQVEASLPKKECFCFPKRKCSVWYCIITAPGKGNGAMLASIVLAAAGMTVASWLAVLCGIRAPIEKDGEWSMV